MAESPGNICGQRVTELMREQASFDYAKHLRIAVSWACVLAAVFLLWTVREGILVVFAAILTAVLLRRLGRFVSDWSGFGIRTGLSLAALLVFALGVATVWLFGSQVAGQINDVVNRVQQSGGQLSNLIGTDNNLINTLSRSAGSGISELMTMVTTFSLTAAEAAVVIVVAGLYLAAQPELYRRGLLALFHRASQRKIEETLDVLEKALVRWLIGQAILMVIIGTLTFLALSIIGVPNVAGLSVVAGVAELVPYVGPFIGAAPAIMVALTQGLPMAVWTASAYLFVHLIEGYLLAPLINHRFVFVPPALVLFAIILAHILFGVAGLLLAAPLTIVVFIGVKALYVRDTLQRPTDLPGEG